MKTKNQTEGQPQVATTAGLATPMDGLAEAEAELMKAATEFGRMWGQNQTIHPKMYWLELHLENWKRLSLAAVNYSAACDVANDPDQATARRKQ